MPLQSLSSTPHLRHHRPRDYILFGTDRVHIWVDRDELPLPESILDDGTTVELSPHPMKYHALWKLQLQLRQPSRRALLTVERSLGHDVRALLNYVEIVLDVLCDSRAQARALQSAFIASVKMKHQQQILVIHKGTAYIGRLTKSDRKPGHVLCVYSDRPSKLNSAKRRRAHAACLHIEWRATGARALEMLGIVTTRDLLDFDHRAFWAERIQLFVLPERKAELGRILHAAKGQNKHREITDRALRANASRWIQRHEIDGQFAVHNALLGQPEIARRLKTVPIAEWLKREISRTEKRDSNSALKISENGA
jgi:hypothetical protein